MQFPYKNKIDKFLVEICRFTGADEGYLPFLVNENSRQSVAIINGSREPDRTKSILRPRHAKTHPKRVRLHGPSEGKCSSKVFTIDLNPAGTSLTTRHQNILPLFLFTYHQIPCIPGGTSSFDIVPILYSSQIRAICSFLFIQ